MACEGCNSEDLELCSCEDGKNSFTVLTAPNVGGNYTIANPLTINVSNTGQYTGAWAKVDQIIFIEGYGYYKVTASTSTTITIAFPPSPFIGGASYSLGSIDYSNSGTMTTGAKISPGGVKGTAGTAGAAGASLIAIDHNQLGANNPTSQTSYSAVQETVTIDSDNRLDATGDSLRIRAKFFYNYVSGTDASEVKIDFYQTGPIVIPLITYPIDAKYPGLEVEIILTRGATAGTIDFTTRVNLFTHFGYTYSTEAALGIGGIYYNEGIAQGGTINFATDFEIQFSGKVSDAANAVKVGFYSVEFLNKI